MKRIFLKHKIHYKGGQVVVEYAFMILVVVTLVLSVYEYIRDFAIGNAENCTPGDNTSLICTLNNLYANQNYRYFAIRR